MQKRICRVSLELVAGVQIIVVLHHLQHHHESSVAASPVLGFGDEGQSTPYKVKSGLMGGFQGPRKTSLRLIHPPH